MTLVDYSTEMMILTIVATVLLVGLVQGTSDPWANYPDPLWVCSMSPDKGPCNMNRQRWYYDDDSNSCKKFTFGGCNGNRNNFPSKESCEQRCKDVFEIPRKEICSQPLVSGPCRAYMPSYGFKDGKCQSFVYGGCQGNYNRWRNKVQCENFCSDL